MCTIFAHFDLLYDTVAFVRFGYADIEVTLGKLSMTLTAAFSLSVMNLWRGHYGSNSSIWMKDMMELPIA